ncbi:DUF948 domain-containing protein [Gottfriedia acidiceleris]|uniref:DUF948 domain-containing protein n=1 Tax=Gottfriedia acidiceleris TaxID=371036 RepID=UPI000B44340D|nr:DUF948 domain-containing protein [Gottfriedia acidiceleris]
MDLISVSVLIAVIAFVILVVFISRTLFRLERLFRGIEETVTETQKDLHNVCVEAVQLVHTSNHLANEAKIFINNSNELTKDMRERAKSLDVLAKSVEEVGVTISEMNEKVRDTANNVSNTVKVSTEKMSQVVNWGTTAMDIWEKYKTKREGKKKNGKSNINDSTI